MCSGSSERSRCARSGTPGTPVTVSFREQRAAGVTDLVVAQSPDPGAALGSTGDGAVTVTVTVATPARMPDLRGKPVGRARTLLEQLGAVVIVRRVVRPAAPPGLVAASVPASGRPVPDTVSLAVNDPGESLSLALLDAVDDDGCGDDDGLSVNGHRVGPSVVCEPHRGSRATGTWNLGRKAALLTFLLGIEDAGVTDPVHLKVLGDGKVLLERDVTFGNSASVRVDVAGVLRLRVEATTRSEDGPVLVLGDAALVGRAEDLADLQGTW